jgi:hypothetical protein
LQFGQLGQQIQWDRAPIEVLGPLRHEGGYHARLSEPYHGLHAQSALR